MKRAYLITMLTILSSLSLKAQTKQESPKQINIGLGVGGEYFSPYYGLSAIITVSHRSAFQLIANPSAVGEYNGSIYFLRYLYKYPIRENADFFLMAGIGALNWKYTYSNYLYNMNYEIPYKATVYSFGAGYEIRFGKFGISGKVGLGNTNIVTDQTAFAISYALGAHYYLLSYKNKVKQEKVKPVTTPKHDGQSDY